MKTNFSYEQDSVNISSLSLAAWRTTHVLKPDLKLLADSIKDYGMMQSIIVRTSNLEIIDGSHRYMVLQSDKSLLRPTNGKVDVIKVDCSEIEAMIMHIRINRGRGNIVSHLLSRLIKTIYHSDIYDIGELENLLGMNMVEMDMMLDGSLIKMRKVSEHTYSKAWVPIEAPAGATDSVQFERPPNKDR